MARYLITEAARQTDVEAHVLRYWEEELELEIPRNELGHRYYTEEHIQVFNHIKEMKAQGFQLKAIKDSLAEAAKEAAATAAAAKEAAFRGEEENAQPAEGVTGQAGGAEADVAPATKTAAAIAAIVAGPEPAQPAVLAREDRMGEFESIVYDIVTEALRNNNDRLSRDVSDRVNDKVVKEMNYLMRENESRMEEHFRKLDEALVKKRKKNKRDSEAAVTKVTSLPVVSQTKRRRRLFGRKRKTTMY